MGTDAKNLLDSEGATPASITYNMKTQQLNQQKMEEIMLKNIWEIENNPIFSSSGASVSDEKDFNSIKAGVIKQFGKDTSSFKDSTQGTQQLKVNLQHIDLDSDYQ